MGNETGRPLTDEELRARDIKAMDWETKKKFSKGVQYNMKVVIRGDRNTGKTCLFRRLQGLPFVEEYIPTPEIQVMHLNWNYKTTNDVIKLEVWDVVDKAKKKKSRDSLKISNDDDSDEESAENANPVVDPAALEKEGKHAISQLDAKSVNVYKGVNAVIVMFDITKRWTFDYACNEITQRVPRNVDVLLLANFRDLGERRVVPIDEIREFCRQAGENVKALEVSMKNRFGLKSIECFFNLPFLRLQRSFIERELYRNSEDIEHAEEELKLMRDQNYDFYLEYLRQTKDNKGKRPADATTVSAPSATPSAPPQVSRTASNPALPTNTNPSQTTPTNATSPPIPRTTTPQPTTPVSSPPVEKKSPAVKKTGSFFSRLQGVIGGIAQKKSAATPASKPAAKPEDPKKTIEALRNLAQEAKTSKAPSSSVDIESFAPEENADDFLAGDSDEDSQNNANKYDDDDDEDGNNDSLVAADEDLEGEVVIQHTAPAAKRAEKERAERERIEREKAERERAEREQAEKARSERERAEKERAAREKAEQQRAAATVKPATSKTTPPPASAKSAQSPRPADDNDDDDDTPNPEVMADEDVPGMVPSAKPMATSPPAAAKKTTAPAPKTIPKLKPADDDDDNVDADRFSLAKDDDDDDDDGGELVFNGNVIIEDYMNSSKPTPKAASATPKAQSPERKSLPSLVSVDTEGGFEELADESAPVYEEFGEGDTEPSPTTQEASAAKPKKKKTTTGKKKSTTSTTTKKKKKRPVAEEEESTTVKKTKRAGTTKKKRQPKESEVMTAEEEPQEYAEL